MRFSLPDCDIGMESRDWEEISHCDIHRPGPLAGRIDECMKCDKITDRDDVIEQK